ncbi:hypothetical protein E2C01_099184 [Portunus trituberculatus]|uniref:Uncharacterized protein n=1 Tax=Portunus trituberculatus TaxID=210409 RepID=A0A5B7K4U0_PORTR|nr:hypothetical protein [Portunus trituberculatus]
MRKIGKFRPKILLALVVVAVLVTLLGPYSYTPRFLDVPTASPTPSIYVSLHREGNIEDRSKNETRQISKAESRAEKEVEEIQILQDALSVSHESYIQNPPPKDWVEVKKTKPKKGRITGRSRSRMSAREKLTVDMKVLGYSPEALQDRAKTFPEDSVSVFVIVIVVIEVFFFYLYFFPFLFYFFRLS